jgi:hypothetical protein
LLSRTHTSRGHKFAWADAESGMQTRHDPLPFGVRYWEILTDQNSGFKRGGRTNLHRTPFPNVLRLYLAERTNCSAGNVDAGRSHS